MRFKRKERHSYNWTPAKEAAYLRKPQRVNKKLTASFPLISDQLIDAHQFISLEEEKERREASNIRIQIRSRNFHADMWRKARQLYFACDAPTRKIIKETWDRCIYPADPNYLIYVIEQNNGDAERRRLYYEVRNREVLEEINRKNQCEEEQLDLFKYE